MTENQDKTLTCGCTVRTSTDFLGRVVGRITTRGAECTHDAHVAGHVVVMPGRQHARPQDR
jgi:hypothetical protein